MTRSMPLRAQFFRLLAKYLVNPIVRQGMRFGIVPASVALIETTGRRSGIPRQTPVLNGLDVDTFWLFAEHGNASDYVRNLQAAPRVRVRVGGTWRAGTAAVLPAHEAIAHRREIERRHGIMGWLDVLMFRAAATDPLTIRIDLDH
jgi:deazaflavin-dependent oxidoreductase (nitroreductase family)